MNELTININWIYFLGIIGSIILIAWRTSARFTAIETSMTWVKESLRDLKINAENARTPAFAAHSPINLNATGEQWLIDSGLKEYIDLNRDYFIKICQDKKGTNPYEVQEHTFSLFSDINFDPALDDKLKKFAFEKGTSMGVLRRIGAIHLRNLCLESFGMNKDDIDKHVPKSL